MSGGPRIPYLKYTTYETFNKPDIKRDWYDENEHKKFLQLETKNAFDECGAGPDGQKCVLGYKYTAMTLTRHKGLVNGMEGLMTYSVNADSDTNVTFNGVGYSPRWIYVINPLGEIGISGDDNKDLGEGTNKNYKRIKRSLYPFQDALYVKDAKKEDLTKSQGDSDEQLRILRRKKDSSEKSVTEFIIEHQSKASTDREKLWLVIPMNVHYTEGYDAEDNDEGGGRGRRHDAAEGDEIELADEEVASGTVAADVDNRKRSREPTTHFERALKWMYREWVDGEQSSSMDPTASFYNQPVELDDAIPKLMSSSPYTYIKHENDGTVHHILHFKWEKVRRVNHKFRFGYIPGIKEMKDKVDETKFSDYEIHQNMEIYDARETGAELIKNYKNKVNSKKGVNMVCRPVKIGGDKDEKNFVVAQEKKERTADPAMQLDLLKKLQGPGMFFGIAVLILILLILIIPVGTYYATTGKSIPLGFFLALGSLLVAPMIMYIVSNGIFA